MIKKIFSILNTVPAFNSLFKQAITTGKIDPVATVDVLSNISPSTKKCADTAKNTIAQGGNIPDAMRNLINIGEVEVMGQKVNTKTLTKDLREHGGTVGGILANWLENAPNQSEKEIINFGNSASDLNNWAEIIK